MMLSSRRPLGSQHVTGSDGAVPLSALPAGLVFHVHREGQTHDPFTTKISTGSMIGQQRLLSGFLGRPSPRPMTLRGRELPPTLRVILVILDSWSCWSSNHLRRLPHLFMSFQKGREASSLAPTPGRVTCPARAAIYLALQPLSTCWLQQSRHRLVLRHARLANGGFFGFPGSTDRTSGARRSLPSATLPPSTAALRTYYCRECRRR